MIAAYKIHRFTSPRENFHYSILQSAPWRKLAIGSANGLGYSYAQNLQSIYFDVNDNNSRLGILIQIHDRSAQQIDASKCLFRRAAGTRSLLECMQSSSLSTRRRFHGGA
jgi:hypothetical protein